MAELLFALGRQDVRAFQSLDRVTIEETYGAKVLINEPYSIVDEAKSLGYAAVARFARVHGAKKILVDSRLANDTGEEIEDAVGKIVGEVTQPLKNDDLRRLNPRPDFLSASVDIPGSALNSFKKITDMHKIAPAIHITSSRMSEQDFQNRGTTAEKNAIWKTNLAINSGFLSGFVVCAAVDAEVVKSLNPNFVVFGTGAMLADNEEIEPISLRHERPSLIEDVRPFVDVFILGSPIFQSRHPESAAKLRIQAARG